MTPAVAPNALGPALAKIGVSYIKEMVISSAHASTKSFDGRKAIEIRTCRELKVSFSAIVLVGESSACEVSEESEGVRESPKGGLSSLVERDEVRASSWLLGMKVSRSSSRNADLRAGRRRCTQSCRGPTMMALEWHLQRKSTIEKGIQ